MHPTPMSYRSFTSPSSSSALACCALAFAVSAFGNDAGLRRCATIASALERLDCYDELARSADRDAATLVLPGDDQTSLPATQTPPSEARAPINALRGGTPRQSVPTSVSGSDFGFEQRLNDGSADQITSRYDGAFTGWSGNTLFRLANGQVWKQAQSGRSTFHRDRPRITIRRGSFGIYRLTVEGQDKSIRVTRIK